MIINACGDGPLGQLGAKAVNGVCSFPLPNVPVMTVALSIVDKTLHAGMNTLGASSSSVELTPLGKELADGTWQDAFWGHGSLLANDQNLATQFSAMPMPLDVRVINGAIHAMTMLNEFGIAARVDGDALRFVVGLRTAWSNPDDVVAKLLAIAPADVLAGKGPALAAPIATKGTPLENDLKSGYTLGMMVPMEWYRCAQRRRDSRLSRLPEARQDYRGVAAAQSDRKECEARVRRDHFVPSR